MTVVDRYTRALTSRNLRAEDWRACDLDSLIAAGVVKSRLPFLLFRARAEYDSLKASLRPDEIGRSPIKALPATYREAIIYLRKLANRDGFSLTQNDAHTMAGAIIEEWLNIICESCHGTKYRSVPGTGRLSAQACESCGGSGRVRGARVKLAAPARAFLSVALSELEIEAAGAKRAFARLVR